MKTPLIEVLLYKSTLLYLRIKQKRPYAGCGVRDFEVGCRQAIY